MLLTFTVKKARARFCETKELKVENIACCIHCLDFHLHHINENRHAFLATNG